MELLYEIAENHQYLHSISQFQQELVQLEVLPASSSEVSAARAQAGLQELLSQPLGEYFLRKYSEMIGGAQILELVDEVDDLSILGENEFQRFQIRKIVRKFTKKSGCMSTGVGDVIRRYMETASPEDALEKLLKVVLDMAMADLELSLFPRFINSSLFDRFVSWKVKENTQVTIEDFTTVRVMGEGGFGRVFSAVKNDTRRPYAIKTISKEKVIKKKREELIMNERNILVAARHPFIVDMVYAFHDNKALYIVQSLCTGGDLFFHYRRFKTFPESWCRFYAAQIGLALAYMHSVGIIYRDLKPENVLLDSTGNVRIVDLGLCAFTSRGERLKEHCGTRSFMSPEQSVGTYTFTCDWWSLGVLLYQMIHGSNPFKSKNRTELTKKLISEDNVAELVKIQESAKADSQIMGMESRETKNEADVRKQQERLILIEFFKDTIKNLEFDPELSPDTVDFLKGLLTFDPSERLGANSSDEVIQHPFFKSIDWDSLLRKHVPPPFVPSSTKVNANFLESAQYDQPKPMPLSYDSEFEGFNYTAPFALQKEILDTIHMNEDILFHKRK